MLTARVGSRRGGTSVQPKESSSEGSSTAKGIIWNMRFPLNGCCSGRLGIIVLDELDLPIDLSVV